MPELDLTSAGNVLLYAILGVFAVAGIVFGKRSGTERGNTVEIAGALIDKRQAGDITAAIEANTRAVLANTQAISASGETVEAASRAAHRAADEARRVTDELMRGGRRD